MGRALLRKTLLLCLIGSALASKARMEPARRLLEDSDDHDHDHGDHSVDMKYVHLNLTEIHGVWFGLGDQIPASVSSGYMTAGFPNCTENAGTFDFQHFNPTDPHFRSITTMDGTTMVSSFGHNRASTSIVAAHEEDSMKTVAGDGTEGCMHFKTFIDLRTGEIKATSLWKVVWSAGPNGTVTRGSANCEIAGDEEPGCMESGSAADGTFTVTGVGRSTFVCSAGPCLAFSPLFNPEGGHAHAH